MMAARNGPCLTATVTASVTLVPKLQAAAA
jgi:hypothetical protein